MPAGPNRQRRLMLAAGAAGTAVLLTAGCGQASYPHGAPLVVEVGDLPYGKLRTLAWKGLPVWVLRRTSVEVAALAAHEAALMDPKSLASAQPSGCINHHRSLRPELFVAIGLCTHQGCTPALLGDAGFLCPCHASRYDLAGRVFRAGPATANLVIPAYRFDGENRLLLGVEA